MTVAAFEPLFPCRSHDIRLEPHRRPGATMRLLVENRGVPGSRIATTVSVVLWDVELDEEIVRCPIGTAERWGA